MAAIEEAWACHSLLLSTHHIMKYHELQEERSAKIVNAER
jgi:hypothetical protein